MSLRETVNQKGNRKSPEEVLLFRGFRFLVKFSG